jgi:hypothetical protein
MDGQLAGGESAVQLMTPLELDRLPQHAVMNSHLAGGGWEVQRMMPLERGLPQERASRLLDGESMYEYEELYADALSVQRSLYEDELSKCALEYARRRATTWRAARWRSHRRCFGNTFVLKAGRE